MWTADELTRVSEADELRVAPRRTDGTLRGEVPIWVVRRGDDLYVRSARGAEGRWYRGTQERYEGHITAGGVAKDVDFVAEKDTGVNDEIDTAYRTKYARYSNAYVDP